jgi:nucleoside diphosphate kinase
MAVTRTFSIIKPDATRRNLTGAVTRSWKKPACASSLPSASR